MNKNNPLYPSKQLNNDCDVDNQLDKLLAEIHDKPTTKEINRLIIDKCDCIKMLLVSKNTSYAAALFNPINQFSSLSAKETCNVLIDNKLSRLKNGKQYKNENDILDLVGYLINLLVIIDIETPIKSPNV